MRETCVGPYLDGFETALTEAGYAHLTVRGYLRAAEHLAWWADRRNVDIRAWDEDLVQRFRRQHLPRCKCFRDNKGTFGHESYGLKLLFKYLRATGVMAPALTPSPKFAPILEEFAAWMLHHRGLTLTSARIYRRMLQPFVETLGEDPRSYTISAVRAYVVEHLGRTTRGKARLTVTALRSFLRYLVVEGRVSDGVQHCVPTLPKWRLSSLPKYIEASEVDRVVTSCDLTTTTGLRDRAILLLLARLGLRGSDIVAMTLDDIDWRAGTLRVGGKGRSESRLPLPQEVGDAVLAYLRHGRPRVSTERLFIRAKAPLRGFASSVGISTIVRSALARAGIEDAPSGGAHLLRHSAATAMLRAGGALDIIAAVLRHRSPDTTAIYAKVDIAMLQQVTQPWPGGAAC